MITRMTSLAKNVGHVVALFLKCPTLSAGDIVVMDNLGAYKVAGIDEAIEARGARVIYLPSSSSDLNPIEKCRSKVGVPPSPIAPPLRSEAPALAVLAL